MAVYDSQTVFVILGRNLTGRVRTEGADFIVEGRSVVYKLCLVEVLVEEFHDLVADFNADTDINGADLGIDSVVVTDVGEPVGTFAADGGDDFVCLVGFVFIGNDTLCSSVFDDDIFYHRVEFHVDAVCEEVILQAGIDLVAFLGSEVADRAFDQL